MKILAKLQASKQFWFLLIASVVFFLLRLPSLFEPYWYGDEGIYEVIGFALRHGRLLYTGIWDNKPPVLYLIYALFSGDQTAARFLSLLAGLFATWAIFFLSKRIFEKFIPAAITTAIFAFLFGIPLIEGNIANAENFMLLPGILAGLLVYKSFQTSKKRSIFNFQLSTFNLLLAGFLLGFSFLIKVVALFDLSAFAVFIFIVSLKEISVKEIIRGVKNVIPLVVGFVIPLIICAGFFVSTHTFSTFIKATLFSNVGYVNYGNQTYLSASRQVIPQGFLILKTLLVGIATLFFLIRRKHISSPTLFIYLWIIFALYASLFSGRPYTHYSLIMLPAFSLLFGLFFANKKLAILSGISIVTLVIFVVKSFTFYSHTFAYYVNFAQLVAGQKSETDYQSFFDKIVPRDYALAEFINANLKAGQTLFIWGNSGQIYKLTNTLPTGRFIVAYHVTMSKQNTLETKEVLQENKPTFIILIPGQNDLPVSLAHYQERLIIDGATIYEHTL